MKENNYDNTDSGLSATTYQEAIDEVQMEICDILDELGKARLITSNKNIRSAINELTNRVNRIERRMKGDNDAGEIRESES